MITFERFIYYKNSISPKSKVITFGRLSKQIPKFFFQFGIDAVSTTGDYESAVYHYIDFCENKRADIPGVMLNKNDVALPGQVLSADEWVLPDVNDIPYNAYNFMYRDDLNKFCGIPERQELVVPLARGCPVNCSYCDVPWMQGRQERRLSVAATIEYIANAFNQKPFEYVSFYAPTFTLNRKWVMELCQALISLDRVYPWKCVTVLKMLDKELLENMGKSGCIRISLGIETFSDSAAGGLPKVKREMKSKFAEITRLCLENKIELNCFVMLGFPEDTPEQVFETADFCKELGARVRPTLYTPYHLLHEHMSVLEVSQFNRQLFVPDSIDMSLTDIYYDYFFHNKNDNATKVMLNIPQIKEAV
jgi:anaerobic magnesium-protoporphyrin IX monomethyl ester cyclase